MHLIVPDRDRTQISEKWLAKGLCALFVPYQGRMIDVYDWIAPFEQGLVPKARLGRYPGIDYSGGVYQRWRGANRRYALTSPLGATIVALVTVDAFTNYGGIIACQQTTTTNGWEFRLGGNASTDSLILCHRSHASGFRQAAAVINQIDNSNPSFLAVNWRDNLIENPPYCLTPNTTTVTQWANLAGSGTGAITVSSSSELWIGRRYDGATYLDGGIHLIALFDRSLPFGDMYDLREDPFQVIEARAERRYFMPAAGNVFNILRPGIIRPARNQSNRIISGALQ